MRTYYENYSKHKMFCPRCGCSLGEKQVSTEYDPKTGEKIITMRKYCSNPKRILGIFPVCDWKSRLE